MTFSKSAPNDETQNRPLFGMASLLLLGTLLGCSSRGDVNIQQTPTGEAPTCVNLCGRVTAKSDADFDGCGVFASKDRETCLTKCKAVAPSEEDLRCGMMSPNCEALNNCNQLLSRLRAP